MKLPILLLTPVLAALLEPSLLADEPSAGGCKCEMMKKPAAPPAAETSQSDAALQQRTEIDKLVAEMNGNLGPKKIEAMAAIITRLAEQLKAGGGAPAPKAEAHQH